MAKWGKENLSIEIGSSENSTRLSLFPGTGSHSAEYDLVIGQSCSETEAPRRIKEMLDELNKTPDDYPGLFLEGAGQKMRLYRHVPGRPDALGQLKFVGNAILGEYKGKHKLSGKNTITGFPHDCGLTVLLKTIAFLADRGFIDRADVPDALIKAHKLFPQNLNPSRKPSGRRKPGLG